MSSREDMIEELMWNDGGYGFGVCSVMSSMIWDQDRPGPGKEDLKSIVVVTGPPEKYTDRELAVLVEFSKQKTAEYDKLWKIRRGANLVLFDKQGDSWLRKRLSWTEGRMWSPNFEDAIATMTVT